MSCDVTYEQLACYDACELPPGSADRMAEHVDKCTHCRQKLQVLRAMDSALRILPKLEPTAAAVLRTRRAFGDDIRPEHVPEVLTLEEVADFLRIPAAILDEVADDLPAFEIGGEIRVRRARLLEWIEMRENAYLKGAVESDVSQILAGL